MAIIRWEPTRELATFQHEMNRLFNSFFDTPTHQGAGQMRRWLPATDLIETEDAYVLRVDLPGLSEADVSIEVEDGVLTIAGERRATHEDRQAGAFRLERAFGSFSRSLTLPDGVDAEAIRAGFDKGVLEVRVPKPEQRRPRRVAISVAGSGETPPAIDGAETAGAEPSAAEAAGTEPASAETAAA